jgi:hypothetical protein
MSLSIDVGIMPQNACNLVVMQQSFATINVLMTACTLALSGFELETL